MRFSTFDGTTNKIVDRYFISSSSVPYYPDTSTTRDGTAMVGDGATKKIILRRTRLAGGSARIDAVIRGFRA
jgi:hypothetical protein